MQKGFIVEKILEPRGWKVLETTAQVPMIERLICPACSGQLQEIVALVSLSDFAKVRLGCCDACSTVHYMDLPTHDWIDNFYTNSWDKNENTIPRRKTPKRTEIVTLVESLSDNKSDLICDIGCGYGGSLYNLQVAGFKNLIGIENSSHRAELARNYKGVKIFTGDFTDANITKNILAHGRPKIMFSAHVLEHVWDPKHFIETAYNLQDKGGYLIINVPNIRDEVAMAVIMFLPHLTSFTPEGLKKLLTRCGYQVMEDKSSNKEISIVAKKIDTVNTSGSLEKPTKEESVSNLSYSNVLNKLESELRLEREIKNGYERMWWIKHNNNIGGRIPYYKNSLLDKPNVFLHSFNTPLNKARSIAISNIEQYHSNAPIEIQFRNKIKLFYK